MGLAKDVEELKNILTTQAKEKKFKYPFGKKVSKGQRKKNYVTVLVINENGSCDFRKYQIEDQTIVHDFIPRIAATGHVLRDKSGNPVIILPNWSVEPFSPLDHYNQSFINGSNKNGYKLLMARMESEKITPKKKMSGWIAWVIGIILVGIVVYAIVSGGGNNTPSTGGN